MEILPPRFMQSTFTLQPSGQQLLPQYLVDAISHSLQRELSRPIHGLAVIRGSPAGTIDVNNLGHVANGRCLDYVCHEGLIQHPDT